MFTSEKVVPNSEPSTSSDPHKDIIPGYATVNDFTKVIQSTKHVAHYTVNNIFSMDLKSLWRALSTLTPFRQAGTGTITPLLTPSPLL